MRKEILEILYEKKETSTDEISITIEEVKSILKNNLNTLRNKIESIFNIRE